MEAQGGSNNAFTSDDVTVYQDWIPRTRARPGVRPGSPTGSRICPSIPKVIESERGVVYSERRLRIEDSNEGFLVEQVQATAFVAHPYQIPTIGWPADIQSWKIEDLQKFFKTNYAPNNCTLILVGDVSAEEGFALAKKYLEPIPRQEPPPPVRTTEPEQLGEKRVLRAARRADAAAVLRLQVAGGQRPAGPGHQSADVHPHRRRFLAPASAAGGREEARHRSRRLLSRKVSIPASPGCSSRCPKAPRSREVEKVLDAALAQVVAQGVTDAELARAKNLYAVVVLEAARHHQWQGAAC